MPGRSGSSSWAAPYFVLQAAGEWKCIAKKKDGQLCNKLFKTKSFHKNNFETHLETDVHGMTAPVSVSQSQPSIDMFFAGGALITTDDRWLCLIARYGIPFR